MEMVARFFGRTQLDRGRVVPFQVPDATALIDRLDDIEALRRLVQRSSAATIYRLLVYVAAKEGQSL